MGIIFGLVIWYAYYINNDDENSEKSKKKKKKVTNKNVNSEDRFTDTSRHNKNDDLMEEVIYDKYQRVYS
jgi:hypothetical protein